MASPLLTSGWGQRNEPVDRYIEYNLERAMRTIGVERDADEEDG
jgi:hypothetical protein